MLNILLLQKHNINYNPLLHAGEDILFAGQLFEKGLAARKMYSIMWMKPDKSTSSSIKARRDNVPDWQRRHSSVSRYIVRTDETMKFRFKRKRDGKICEHDAAGRYEWGDFGDAVAMSSPTSLQMIVVEE